MKPTSHFPDAGSKERPMWHIKDTGEQFQSRNLWSESSAPLHFAIIHKNIEEVRSILSHKSSRELNRRHQSLTPLHLAVRWDDYDITELLLKEGAEVNAIGREMTPLDVASKIGNPEVVKLLIQYGANANASEGMMSSSLHCAVASGHAQVIQVLLENGVDIEWRNPCGGLTAFDTAVFNNQLEAAEMLISAGYTVNMADKWGHTPLYYAVENNNRDIVKLLLSNGGHEMINTPDTQGRLHLHMASSRGDEHIVKQLVTAGAHVDSLSQGKTALYIASQKGYYPIVRHLLDHGADPDVLCECGNTALHTAVSCRKVSTDIVCGLIQCGANVDIKNDWNHSPLQTALMHGSHEASRLLLNADANIWVVECEYTRMLMSGLDVRDRLRCNNYRMFADVKALRRLCRSTLRQAFGYGKQYRKNVERLELPDIIKQFLLFKDI